MHPQHPDDFQHLIRLVIGPTNNLKLTAIPGEEEVRRAVFSMASNKSPGLDGMTVNFYKTYWNITKEAMLKEIQQIFQTGIIKEAHNHTFWALIPKSRSASNVDQFRHIALCNVFFKVITKIIATRLRQFLDIMIHPCQSAFIPHRAINDNIIINHEVMHCLRRKTGKKRFHGYSN